MIIIQGLFVKEIQTCFINNKFLKTNAWNVVLNFPMRAFKKYKEKSKIELIMHLHLFFKSIKQ